jgi:hypothetical protein
MNNFNSIKIILLFILAYFVYTIVSKKNIENMANFKESKSLKKKIYYGLNAIDKIFNKHKIYYTIGYGTLLGAVRHWDVIDWDDDADLHIYNKDIPKIMKLKEEFAEYGLILEKNWKLVKIYFNDTKYPFIDLFPVDNSDGDAKRCMAKYTQCHQVDQAWWTKYYGFPFKWLVKRKRVVLGKTKVWAPLESLKLLKFWYGKDCLTKCMTHNYDHITGQYVKPKVVKCKNLPDPQL